jgi:hypothetical protein
MKFPIVHRPKLEKLAKVHDDIELTHRGLGELAIMNVLADASNRAMMIIGSSGQGKSKVREWMAANVIRPLQNLDSITIPGLRYLQDKLNGGNYTILCDDLSKGGSQYAQVATVTALGELCYSGFIQKYISNMQLDINGFKGAILMNCQPLILRRILQSAEFETDIRDKVIRYYHLYRTRKISNSIPVSEIRYHYNYKDIAFPDTLKKSAFYKHGLTQFHFEFTEGRSMEHFEALCKASAAVNEREEVDITDMWLVLKLTRNFYLETEIFSKKDLEGSRELDVNLLPILSIFNTFGRYPLLKLMADFQVKKSRIMEIVKNNEQWCAVIKNSEERYLVPTAQAKELLEEIKS